MSAKLPPNPNSALTPSSTSPVKAGVMSPALDPVHAKQSGPSMLHCRHARRTPPPGLGRMRGAVNPRSTKGTTADSHTR
jgi:hypothetical protein